MSVLDESAVRGMVESVKAAEQAVFAIDTEIARSPLGWEDPALRPKSDAANATLHEAWNDVAKHGEQLAATVLDLYARLQAAEARAEARVDMLLQRLIGRAEAAAIWEELHTENRAAARAYRDVRSWAEAETLAQAGAGEAGGTA